MKRYLIGKQQIHIGKYRVSWKQKMLRGKERMRQRGKGGKERGAHAYR